MALVKCQTISGKTIEVEETKLFPRPCVYGLVVNDKNELLVENPKEEGEKYWFIGGGLEKDEDPELALTREAKEEAGVNIKVIEVLTSLEYCYYHNKLNKYFRCNSDFYLCKYISPASTPSTQGVKTKWLKINKLNEGEFHLLIRKALEVLKVKLGCKKF
jgi:mutator protein MutT